MKIMGFMGSPRIKGLCSQFTESFLKGAESRGAEVRQVNLVKQNVTYCRGCYACVHHNHEKPLGKCPVKDDMAGILEEYLAADGYLMACPVYDFTVTSIMKAFIERRFSLYKKVKGNPGIPEARVKQHFMKKAALIATGSAGDEYASIAEPCFDVMGGHFMIEEIDVVDQLYVGRIHFMDPERYRQKMDETFAMGQRLVDEIHKARNASDSRAQQQAGAQ